MIKSQSIPSLPPLWRQSRWVRVFVCVMASLLISIQSFAESDGKSIRPWEWDWSALAAFGAACIAAVVGVYGIWRSNKTAASTLQATYELKILEFRQNWIDNLRVEMIGFQSIISANIFEKNIPVETISKLNAHGKAIQLLMNVNDLDYDKLLELMTKMLKESSKMPPDIDAMSTCSSEFTTLCQAILKREWERLKSDKDLIINAKHK